MNEMLEIPRPREEEFCTLRNGRDGAERTALRLGMQVFRGRG